MKHLFIVLCDIMFLCMVVAPVAGAVWGLSALFGWAAAGPAKIVCIVAVIGGVVFTLASFIVWTRMDGADDQEEGEK